MWCVNIESSMNNNKIGTLKSSKKAERTLDIVNRGLARRYRAEKRFRFYGLSAIATSLLFLSLLFISIGAEGYSASAVTVKKTEFELTLMTNGVTAPEIIRFSITTPRWCNLNNLSDERREIVERCLRMWGLVNE